MRSGRWRKKRVPFEVPRGPDREARLSSVLEVIYLIFNEGYSATAGDDWMRPALCEDALRLGRILAELVPQEPEVHGLVALMEIQASRAAARVGCPGEPVLLLDQNRARWDQLLIRRGLAALDARRDSWAAHAGHTRCRRRSRPVMRARARAKQTDWPRIAALYEALVRSSAVAGRRAQSRGCGRAWRSVPQAGLAIVDALVAEPSLKNYHLLPSVRGDLLAKLGRRDEARSEFERAAEMTRNTREKALLLSRAQSSA